MIIFSLLKKLLIYLIEKYQRLLSPDHSFWSKSVFAGGFCKFTPSCSEYAKMSLEKNGLFFGTLKSFWRVLRCNPWSKGGLDLP